jgi:deazaflavin-dependent oxidoreductase (nitroreductase family)
VTETPTGNARIPPRWFIRTAWVVHRGLYRITGGRLGLRHPTPTVYGMMRLHTIGRRTGKARVAIVAYFEDGPDVVTMAMNGWGEPPPAWWLNLQATPEATVDLPGSHPGSAPARRRVPSGSACGTCSAGSRRAPTSTRWRGCAHGRRRSSCSSRSPEPVEPTRNGGGAASVVS